MDVDFIYIPYKMKGCHWILAMLDMVEGPIMVSDSLVDLTSNLELMKELDNIRCVVPTLLHRCGVF